MDDADHNNKDTSEKLVPAAASGETASAVTLQKAADDSSSLEELLDTIKSLEESIDASPGTFSRDKLMTGASESASAQTLKKAHVSSSEELIITASLKESTTSSLPTAPCITSPFRHEKTVEGVAESTHAQAMRELKLDQFIEELLDCSSSEDHTTTGPRAAQHKAIDGGEIDLDQLLEELLGYSSSEDHTTASQRAAQHKAIDGNNQRMVPCNTTGSTLPAASSLGSKIRSRCVPHCFYWYYIRMDRQGSFRIYPDLGGPFQSLQEAEDAIDHHHNELRRKARWHVHERKPDGDPYSSTREKSNVDTYRYLVQALMDKYNEDNNLFGDRAHELDEDSMMEQWIYEDHSYYYHYNFTTKKNEAGDTSLGACTFFAEVSHKLGESALEVSCCCKIKDEDNGWCYGCRNNGSHGMRHPKNSDAYAGGHLDIFLPCTLEEPSSSDDDDVYV